MTTAVNNQPKPAVTQADTVAQHVTSTVEDYVPLTAEGILLFCQSRLQDMDTKIQQKMAGQTQLVALQDKITNIQATLKSFGGADGGFDDANKVKALSELLQQAIAEARACGNNTLASTLATVDSKIHQGPDAAHPDNLVTGGEAKEIGSTLDGAMTTCGSSAQVSMIELQSLVAKRATVLQLSTGLVSSFDEGPKAIAGNIGR